MANSVTTRLYGLRTLLTHSATPEKILGAARYLQPISRSLSTSQSTSTNSGVIGIGLAPKPAENFPSPLARLPTSSIIRSLFLGSFFTSPLLFRPGLAVFKAIANSKSALLNPDKNPVLRALIRPVVYDQFCAGRNVTEIQKTSATIKGLGFSGVVLCYGKEVQLDANNRPIGYEGNKPTLAAEIEQWRTGNLNTLDMVSEGDWLGIKLTGSGLNITQALLDGAEAPPEFLEAMNAICAKAKRRNCRIWIDAEQQCLQKTIDSWTYNMMRQWNRGEKALVFNTVQAYLKCSREKVQRQLETASKEGWRSAIKLVRGAYISNDKRDLIHDTKADSDKSYNSIVEDLLTGSTFPVFQHSSNLQHDLLLAGHNNETIRRAASLGTELDARKELKVMPEFAQLQGMADDIGCELLQVGESNASKGSAFVPRVYKCLTWGSIQQSVYYRYLASTGLTGLVVLGTNAETFLLSQAERKELLTLARTAVGADFPIIAGVSGHSTSQVLEYIKDAHGAGSNYALVLPPAYFGKQTTPEVVKSFFARVAKLSPLPVILYNFPAVCNGLDLDSDTIAALAHAHPNIVGVKLTCGSVAKIARLSATFQPERFAVFGGQSDVLLVGLVAGSAGCIAAFGNIFPRLIVEIYSLYQQGRLAEAKQLQAIAALAESPTKAGIANTKYAAAVFTSSKAGIKNAAQLLQPRHPYIAPGPAVQESIVKAMQKADEVEVLLSSGQSAATSVLRHSGQQQLLQAHL